MRAWYNGRALGFHPNEESSILSARTNLVSNALIAQLVEHTLCTVEVWGSNPHVGTKFARFV